MQNFDVFGDNLSPIYPHVGGALQWPLKTREIETLAFVVLSHPEWDHSKLNGGHSKLDRLRPVESTSASAKYGHSKWVHFSLFETR